jgi:hypothetical protein
MSGAGAAHAIDEPSRMLWWLVMVATSAALLAPLFLIDVPPLLDYPNHLARMFVLAHPDDPVLSRMYVPHWTIIPNLAIDLLIPPLMRVLPVYVAGRLMLAVALLLPMIGCAAYSRAVFGRRSLWPIASALMAYNARLFNAVVEDPSESVVQHFRSEARQRKRNRILESAKV